MSEQNRILDSMLNTPKNEEAQKTLDRGRAIINAMSEQNIAFEAWRNGMCIKPLTPQEESNLGWAKSALNYGIKYATAEANRRIAELENQVTLLLNVQDRYITDIAKLQASNNDLREALEKYVPNKAYKDNGRWFIKTKQTTGYVECEVSEHATALEALSATPAESLAKHDDEVIEKCAHEAKIYRANVSVIESIRALKSKP